MADGDSGPRGGGARAIAIGGPYLSGKTSLLEALLFTGGAIGRKGSVAAGNTVGDSGDEARAHQMSVEVNVASVDYLGDRYTFVDCPGSIEFAHEAEAALAAVDAAIVVCEADPARAPAVQPILKRLCDDGIPHWLFVNKIDKAAGGVRDLLAALQPYSQRALVLRQIPIWEDGIAKGFVDLALERAYVYREHAPSERIEAPAGEVLERMGEARYSMLESLADYNDKLMEELLEDIEPPRDEVFEDLTGDLRAGHITPVLLGSAEGGHGVRRLLKALRHEGPSVADTRARLGIDENSSCAQVLKTYQTTHGGKLSLTRVLAGALKDGDTVHSAAGEEGRIGGLFAMTGHAAEKRERAEAGDTVALGRLDAIETGDTISTDKGVAALTDAAPAAPVFGLAIRAADRKDEVKLSAAIGKLREEDPSISVEHNPDTREMVLWGQGEVHLRVGMERLASKFGLTLASQSPKTPYKETLRKSATVRGRHKKQSGGHGQFGDVVLKIGPLPRGSGFTFSDSISGGVVPKQYIPSVEIGVKDYMERGPLGFPMVDVAVELQDGSYHSVDSSDMAFRTAGRIAMAEGAGECSPVLLEPIMDVKIFCPSDATPRINQIVSGRRGQILGFDGREGWEGWDVVSAHMPQSELYSLIIELRSATQGVGSYVASFDHMAELSGRLAEQVIEANKEE